MEELFAIPIYWHTPSKFDSDIRKVLVEFSAARDRIQAGLEDSQEDEDYVRITDENCQRDSCSTYNLPLMRQYIDHHVQAYAIKAGYTLSVQLDHSWFHRVPPGSGHIWHSHGNSHISGTLYLENASSGELQFRSPNPFARAGQFPSRDRATPVVGKIPQDGEIGCWPGYLEHRVLKTSSTKDRSAIRVDYNLVQR